MNVHSITVDVYARFGNPRYRVYVNNDLLTERDFSWPSHEVYIKENIEVRLPAGTHNLRVEEIGSAGKIRLKNITVDGVASATEFIITE